MAKRTARDEDISRRPRIRSKLLKIFEDVDKGFDNQRDRSDEIMDCWDAYQCVLGPKQFYNGRSQLYVPIVRVAINARRTRFVNQMFPQAGDAGREFPIARHAQRARFDAALAQVVRDDELRVGPVDPLVDRDRHV